ncbi:hypothetical protein TIFTF001_049589 [Ficus carica]|uniref:Uncharacterized protein n=1 Tax=Ficus carica TaxID=3494 RepID=A0AA87ZEE1_FICCA|nr:hypothetical protein TIFTF001_049589 [Ficus carica]
MPRRATSESYSWDQAKETVFLEKLDYYVACHSSRHPPISVLDGWAREFNAAFGGVHKECNHLRYEGLRNKELYYNIFEKNHAAGASGYGSVSMSDDSPATVDLDALLDNSGIRPVPGDDVTAPSGTRRCSNRRHSADVGPSR